MGTNENAALITTGILNSNLWTRAVGTFTTGANPQFVSFKSSINIGDFFIDDIEVREVLSGQDLLVYSSETYGIRKSDGTIKTNFSVAEYAETVYCEVDVKNTTNSPIPAIHAMALYKRATNELVSVEYKKTDIPVSSVRQTISIQKKIDPSLYVKHFFWNMDMNPLN